MENSHLEELIRIFKYAALGDNHILDFTFLDNSVRLYLPYAHTDLIQKTILTHRTFFENYLLLSIIKHIEPGSVIADIGANIGNHTVFFGLCCKAEKVYAFEPLKTAFQVMSKNIQINGLNNIEPHNCAVGIEGETLSLDRCTPTNLGGSQFTTSKNGEYPVRSLDSFELDRLDFIKLDVEGLQSPVLKGAQNTLSSLRPKILVEVLDGEEDIFDGFANLEYKVVQKFGKTDYLLEAPKGKKWT